MEDDLPVPPWHRGSLDGGFSSCLLNMVAGGIQNDVDEVLEFAKQQHKELQRHRKTACNSLAIMDKAASELRLLQFESENLLCKLGTEYPSQMIRLDASSISAVESLRAWQSHTVCSQSVDSHATDMGRIQSISTVLLQGLAGLREVQAIIKDFIFQHEGDVPLIQLRTRLQACEAANAALTSRLKEADSAADATLRSIRQELGAMGSLDVKSVEEQIKALELSKAAAEDRAIRAEAAATHLMDELQNFSSIGKKLSERSERREVEEILLHARFGRDGRFEGDELAKVRSWIKYLEDLHVADDVARQKNERERENLSAQVEQLEQNLNLVLADREDRIAYLKEELDLVCAWANRTGQEYQHLEEDYVFLESHLTDEAREAVKLNLRASGRSASQAAVISNGEAPVKSLEGIAEEAELADEELDEDDDTGVALPRESGGLKLPLSLPQPSEEPKLPSSDEPKVPHASGSDAKRSSTRSPRPSMRERPPVPAISLSGRFDTLLQRGRPRTSAPVTPRSPRSAPAPLPAGYSLPQTPLESPREGRVPRAPRASLDGLQDTQQEQNALIQRRARESLTELLETAIARLNQTENELARKDIEINQLRRSLGTILP